MSYLNLVKDIKESVMFFLSAKDFYIQNKHLPPEENIWNRYLKERELINPNDYLQDLEELFYISDDNVVNGDILDSIREHPLHNIPNDKELIHVLETIMLINLLMHATDIRGTKSDGSIPFSDDETVFQELYNDYKVKTEFPVKKMMKNYQTVFLMQNLPSFRNIQKAGDFVNDIRAIKNEEFEVILDFEVPYKEVHIDYGFEDWNRKFLVSEKPLTLRHILTTLHKEDSDKFIDTCMETCHPAGIGKYIIVSTDEDVLVLRPAVC